MNKKYSDILSNKVYNEKKLVIKKLYVETLKILEVFGYPINQTPRRMEKTVGAFLALCNISAVKDLSKPTDLREGRALKTRKIIDWENEHLEENISSGSYDDIRRKDLNLLVLGGIVLKSSPDSATNDSTRGYGINPFYSKLMKFYGKKGWQIKIKSLIKAEDTLEEILKRKRKIAKIPVKLPSGKKLSFSNGEHNILQKKIIEEFLPRYGYDSELLYVGDTSDKYLFVNKTLLSKLGLPEIAHEDLPDILAFSSKKKWIYLIEAVYSSGEISETRLIHFKNIMKNAKFDIVYISAFLDAKTFRKYSHNIAWETEVWIADNPDHMIHFNGDKFFGPYKK